MVRHSPAFWTTERLCQLAGSDTASPTSSSAQPIPLIAPAQIEAVLLQALAATGDMPAETMIVVHFAPIIELYPGSRDHVIGVIEGNAAAAVRGQQLHPVWVAESLVLRFADPAPAIDAVIVLAGRLFGAEFDPGQLPARLLVRSAAGATFEDLWSRSAARDRLARGPTHGTLADEALTFEFRPLWHVATARAMGVICVPCLGDADLTSDQPGLTVSRAAAIDTEVVAHIARLLAAAGSRRLIGMPIHETTLADEALRQRALAPYMALPRAARARAIFEVVAIGADSSRLRLRSALRPLRRATILGRFHISQRDFSDLAAAGFSMVGTDIAMSQRAEAELLPMLSDFAAAAEAAHLPSYVQGLPSLSIKTAAQSAGFAAVAGDPVPDPLAVDLGPFPFSFDAMYGAVAPPGVVGASS